ncbi:MAG: ParB/RepB/Spo0J family partition protein [Candidatus Andersenbacteria bacterium]
MAFGLGRGLEALIPTKATKPARPDPRQGSDTRELPLRSIVPNPHQPRKQFKLPELESLAASIKQHGILEPLVVSPPRTPTGNYILVAGERRLRAAELAGLQAVPVVVRQTDDQEKLELALIENIQRQDLNPLEEAKALRKLLRDFKLTQRQVGERVGRPSSSVANCIRLLDLSSEAQQALLAERISEGHAKVLLAVSPVDQVALIAEIESQHLSVRQLEKRVREVLQTKAPRTANSGSRIQDPVSARLSRTLSRHLGAQVKVDGVKIGRITIGFFSAEERDRLVNKITGTPVESSEEQPQKSPRSAFTV